MGGKRIYTTGLDIILRCEIMESPTEMCQVNHSRLSPRRQSRSSRLSSRSMGSSQLEENNRYIPRIPNLHQASDLRGTSPNYVEYGSNTIEKAISPSPNSAYKSSLLRLYPLNSSNDTTS